MGLACTHNGFSSEGRVPVFDVITPLPAVISLSSIAHAPWGPRAARTAELRCSCSVCTGAARSVDAWGPRAHWQMLWEAGHSLQEACLECLHNSNSGVQLWCECCRDLDIYGYAITGSNFCTQRGYLREVDVLTSPGGLGTVKMKLEIEQV